MPCPTRSLIGLLRIFLSSPRSALNYSLRSLPVSYIAIFWVTTLNETMKSEVRACERLSAYFRKFCLEENRARLAMHQGLDGCGTRSLFASNLSGFCL